jgi:hypothetical protein
MKLFILYESFRDGKDYKSVVKGVIDKIGVDDHPTLQLKKQLNKSDIRGVDDIGLNDEYGLNIGDKKAVNALKSNLKDDATYQQIKRADDTIEGDLNFKPPVDEFEENDENWNTEDDVMSTEDQDNRKFLAQLDNYGEFLFIYDDCRNLTMCNNNLYIDRSTLGVMKPDNEHNIKVICLEKHTTYGVSKEDINMDLISVRPDMDMETVKFNYYRIIFAK